MTDHQKFVTSNYVGNSYSCAKFWCKSVHGGFWANGWNITRILFIYLYLFRELTYRWPPSTDFHTWWLKRCGLAQGCPFWGFRWYCSLFWGEIPQTRIFQAWIGVFNPNGHNIESFMLSNYSIDFNQILHNDRDHQIVIACGPNMRPTNLRWQIAAFLKKTVKWPYLCNRLTYFDEICCDDAYWLLSGHWPLKFRIFENPRWRRPPFWKITKIAISPQQFDRSLRNLVQWCKVSLLTAQTVKNLNF